MHNPFEIVDVFEPQRAYLVAVPIMEIEPVQFVVFLWVKKHLDRSGVLVLIVTVKVPVKRMVFLLTRPLNLPLFAIRKHEGKIG